MDKGEIIQAGGAFSGLRSILFILHPLKEKARCRQTPGEEEDRMKKP